MKNYRKIAKFIGTFFIISSVFLGAYQLKEKMNRLNVQNKNYLATTIRSEKTESITEEPAYLEDALDRDELIQYGKKQFDLQATPQFIEMTNTINYKPTHQLNSNSNIISVGVLIDRKQETLYEKRSYQNQPIDESPSSKMFTIISTGTVDLKTSVLSYRVSLINQETKPQEFIRGLLALVNEVQSRYPSIPLISKVTIEAGQETYLYRSNQPNYLVKIEHLS